MLTLAKEIYRLLEPTQRRHFFVLQFMVIAMSVMELVGIASIGPFMALVADMNLIESQPFFQKLFQLSGLSSAKEFLVMSGIGVLFALAVSAVLSMITTWRLSLFGFAVGTEFADRLYSYYLSRDWLFHTGTSSAELMTKVASEMSRTTALIIVPMLQMNGRIALALFISTSLFILDPMIALIGLCVFGLSYIFIFRSVRQQLDRYGSDSSKAATVRSRLMTEGFGGIKDILVLHRGQSFIEDFSKAGMASARAQGMTTTVGQIPRYIVELFAFSAMIGLILFLIQFYDHQLVDVLPLVGLYGLAGFKLLPSLQLIYANSVLIRGNTSAFTIIEHDLKQATQQMRESKKRESSGSITNYNSFSFTKEIRLANIYFTYPGKTEPALKGVDIRIPVNHTVGLVGATGSGKSTAIDLLMALIMPQRGQLMVDDTVIDETNKADWQRKIGFVPQSIFLTEGSIAENVAFGLRTDEIDEAKVRRALKLAHLSDFVNTLPDGMNTRVGERGVRLSGGQRQRIGIARALYDDSTILVFDEATSALDGITEKIIMKAIDELAGERTIVLIAHRLKTVMNSNIIYMLDGGKVIDSGTYKELIEKNAKFREMARNA